MKKFLICLGFLIVILAIVYYFMNGVPSAELSADKQAEVILDEGGCLACHKADAPKPFYYDYPLAGDLVKKDMDWGLKAFDMEAAMNALKSGEKLNEADLAKIEWSTTEKCEMPPAKYYLVHWGSSITNAKREILKNWAKDYRARYYANSLASNDFSNEAIRPVPDAVPTDSAKVALGEKLYYDTRLSSDNSISCSSCHGLNTGGVDNKQFSEGVGGQLGGVNAPTVFNAYYNFVQFWDGRAADLAAQAAGPPLNPIEMACKSFDEIIDKLQKDDSLSAEFLAIYPDGYSEANITNAIAEFEKTLLTPNCRFDRYLKGDKSAMEANEIAGYEAFKKDGCATCHSGILLGGQTYERMGIVEDYFAERGGEIGVEDMGRYKETKKETDRHRFKTPGLRNIALTAPYFHDGTQKTLRDAVKNMDVYQSSYKLNDTDIDNIVAFLNTLTGEYQGKMLTNKSLQ